MVLKRFYQLYRSPVRGQLRKRYVKKVLKNAATGYRFINLGSVQKPVSDISKHSATCKKAIELATTGVGLIELSSEIDTYGLTSIL